MAGQNGTGTQNRTVSFGTPSSSAVVRPSSFLVEGVLVGGNATELVNERGSNWVHNLNLMLDVGGSVRCAVWHRSQLNLGPVVGQRIQLEILRFKPSQYGVRLDSQANEKYELECRFPDGAVE